MSETSPFHSGELAMQARAGVQERAAAAGGRGIRDYMPEQHRQFFAQLPLFLIGSSDAQGRPWASVLAGAPGFLQSTDPQHLHIAARPLAGDPLRDNLHDGAAVGGLGLEFHTRRRNRINGHVTLDAGGAGFTIAVDQSFGNCAQYINARRAVAVARTAGDSVHASTLTADACAIIARADTFFVASQHAGDPADHRDGIDVSHRGGEPGFVRTDGSTLVWPDYRGNSYFNTLGNLAEDPRAGLLFIDFPSGDLLQLTGSAAVRWDWPRENPAFAGAERLVQFTVAAVIRHRAALPFAWDFLEAAPQFARLKANSQTP